MSEIGARVQSANYLSSVSTSVASDAEASRAGQAGVNLDEEASRLMQYQQGYQAAAKVLQTAQSLFRRTDAHRVQVVPPRPAMRLSTANLYDASIANLQRRQQRPAKPAAAAHLRQAHRPRPATTPRAPPAPNVRWPPSAASRPTSARWKPAATA